ncbi:Guanine nucleotide exchange factor for Cdc42p [Rhodotorula kratochvilovae]
MTSVHPYAAARLAAPAQPQPQPGQAANGNGYSSSSASASSAPRSPLLSAPLPPTPSGSSSNAASPLLGASSASRPQMDRMPSTFGDTPVATNSALNKAASASSSIYQRCNAVRERLLRVPDFRERFFDSTESTLAAAQGALSPVLGGPSAGSAGGADAGGAGAQTDPVSQVLSVLRLGASLCFLFNQLGHAHQLDVNPQATLSNLKACQRGAAHFIMACKQDLRWPEGDLFAVNELYGQDTNGVVKVVHTVTKLLDLLESQGVLLPPPEQPEAAPQAGPSDERSLVVREILDSERKYMQDLEVLQDYQRQLQMNDILTQDQIHSLFINLNKLADFQRRFLIGVEGNASLAPEQQRFGNLFLQMEENFACYEPYCANLTNAQDLAIAENAALSRLAHVLDPVSELAPLLIKPVQRICKYPLLISQLLKNTPEGYPYYDELKAGLESIMRVTDKVNEEKRRKDNMQAVEELNQRVEDWKGHDISSFGQLLLQESFIVIKSDNEREYNVYLFERIILCCKEVGALGKKDKKSNSILKRPPSQRINKLQLKGRIFVNNITGASQIHHRSGQYLLEVRWRGDVTEEAFTIKCRTEELLRQWQKAINKAVEEAPTRRRAHHLSSSRRSERSLHSPASQFPPTPMSEYGPPSAGGYPGAHDHAASSPYYNPAQPSYPPGAGGAPGTPHFGFDDDDERYEPSESGRSTPSSRRRPPDATRSLPPDQHPQHLPRPRAQTEDSNSHVIKQWRAQPPPQRGASQSSDAPSLRSSASSRQLRGKASSEWGASGGPGSITSSPAASYARLPTSAQEEATPRAQPAGVYRQASHGPPSAGVHAHTHHHHYPAAGAGAQAPPMLRNRSASSPNIYAAPGGRFADSPQMPSGEEWAHAQAQAQLQASKGRAAGGTTSGGTLGSATTASSSAGAGGKNGKRFSSSSGGTDRSSATSAHSAGVAYGAGSVPALPSGASSPVITAAATAVRVKVFFGDDAFVVVVLDNVPYPDLVEKVLKKIRMCGGDKARVDGSALRLRYRDEDGDRILITSEEDVAMAFETARVMVADKGAGAPLELVLYAAVDGQ